jgi:hypothetical protein
MSGRSLRFFVLACAAFASAAIGRAMSVIPPTFDELVAAADTVVRGVVTEVHAVTVATSQGEAIKTLVTLQVEKTLKGNPGATLTLSLLGGKVGRRNLKVEGMPTFAVGDREIVFVANNGRAMCPLIAGGHGRYHVRHDAASGRDYVARDNGAPVHSTDELAQPIERAATATAPSAEPLTPDAFETRITETLRSARTQAPQ